MEHLEVACRRFALLSGIAQDASMYVSCVQPRRGGGRKGLLTLVTEPAGNHPALSTGACGLVHEALLRYYYADASVSLTSGLLKALDGANSALLQYNYLDEFAPAATGTESAVVVQAGGVRSRGSQVGLTAVLLRPDGEGVYLAQMLPTQAYMLHQGHLSALPEPASWQRPGKVSVQLHRVPDPDTETNEAVELVDEATLPAVTLPSTPLGSAAAVEVDLLYRRVEPGDLIAVVSSSLARQLDRPLAEEIFSTGSADAAIDALYSLATERGLAQAHACVLEFGVEETSGVDADLPIVLVSEPAMQRTEQPEPPIPLPQAAIGLEFLKSPKSWLSRLRPVEAEHDTAHIEQADPDQFAPTASHDNQASAADEPEIWTERPTVVRPPESPTQLLLHNAPELPPYTATSGEIVEETTQGGELEFDGWEDIPPALIDEPLQFRQRSDAKHESPTVQGDGESPSTIASDLGRQTAPRPLLYTVPTIFEEEDEQEAFAHQEEVLALPVPPASRAQSVTDRIVPLAQKAASIAGETLRSLLPEASPGRATQRAGKGLPWRPRRELIVTGVAVLFLILALSVYTMTRNPKHSEVNQFLAQAQQEDLLANQPSTPASERQVHLNKVMELANQALQVEPDSAEASRLLTKAQATLDTVQGIKRVEPKLLFDLDEASSTGGGQSGPVAGVSSAVSSTGHLAAISVAGNEAYVLDTERGQVYRCQIATTDCTVILKVGDDLGGQKVGSLVDMTMRVGSPLVLDNNFVTFAYTPDTSAWQAQQLGAADQLSQPKDVATYDGNFYLLGAVPSQVSKYVAGQYGQPPTAWVSDPGSMDQIKNPLSLGIDGAIYTLLADGNILVLQGGKVTRTIPAAKPGDEGQPTQLFTGTDTQDLYLLTPKAASLSRMSKEGQVRVTLKPAADSGITEISGMTVDEGNGKFYMLSGRKVYEADLRPTAPPPAPANGTQPSAMPTAAP